MTKGSWDMKNELPLSCPCFKLSYSFAAPGCLVPWAESTRGSQPHVWSNPDPNPGLFSWNSGLGKEFLETPWVRQSGTGWFCSNYNAFIGFLCTLWKLQSAGYGIKLSIPSAICLETWPDCRLYNHEWCLLRKQHIIDMIIISNILRYLLTLSTWSTSRISLPVN